MNVTGQNQAYQKLADYKNGQVSIQDPTVGENLDKQIEYHKSRLAHLEDVKVRLGKDLLDMKLYDAREAMGY
tara:strand:- start:77 stop:292 length:216 start_codon:yes stop_codon:yes gene_type:complete